MKQGNYAKLGRRNGKAAYRTSSVFRIKQIVRVESARIYKQKNSINANWKKGRV